MNYRVVLNNAAQKQFRRLERQVQQNLKPYIHALRHGLNQRCAKLAGHDNLYRLRVGRYRVVFELRQDKLIILLLGVGHRKDIYRTLLS